MIRLVCRLFGHVWLTGWDGDGPGARCLRCDRLERYRAIESALTEGWRQVPYYHIPEPDDGPQGYSFPLRRDT